MHNLHNSESQCAKLPSNKSEKFLMDFRDLKKGLPVKNGLARRWQVYVLLVSINVAFTCFTISTTKN